MTATVRSVVVVPTYDEAATITTLLDALARHAPGTDVLVVDDGSPDGTADLVRAHPRHGRGVEVLSRAVKDGLGGAYRAGFARALAEGYDVVAQMDADLSHPVDRLPALLRAVGEADVVIGSRYARGGAVARWSPGRRLLSRAGNRYVRSVLGLRTRDSTAGFRAHDAAALRAIGATSSTSDGYCFQVENTWRAERLGLRVLEVPITFTDRTAGTSKMDAGIATEALTRVARWRWEELTGDDGRDPARSARRPSSCGPRGEARPVRSMAGGPGDGTWHDHH